MSNSIKFRSVEAELLNANGQTDMTKLIVALRNFANAPKKWHFKRKFNIAVNLNYHNKRKVQPSPA